jgi:hypothetical protein
MVYIDDYPIGTTPVCANFTYYGTRKIRLVKDGYETLTVLQPVNTPWYEVPPLDFFSENMVPNEVRDRRSFFFQLTPQVVVPRDQLLSRAEQLRGQGRAGASAPALPSPGPMTPAEVAPTPVPAEPVPPPGGFPEQVSPGAPGGPGPITPPGVGNFPAPGAPAQGPAPGFSSPGP